MNSQFIVNQHGMFRADAWDELKKEKEQRNERRKQLGITRPYTDAERVDAAVKSMRLDANETNFMARQLLHIMTQTKKVVHPGDILEAAFPINVEGGPGLLSLGYEQLDVTGKFKLISAHGTDLPESSSNQTEFLRKVGVYGGAYGYSQIELERAARGNMPLNSRRAEAAMLAAQKTKNAIAWTGDPDGADIKGLFSSTLSAATISGTWASATADDILDDVRATINKVRDVTEDFQADTLVMDPVSYGYMSSRLSNSDTTVGEFAMSKFGIARILYTSYLSSVTSTENSLSADKVMLAYPRSSLVLEFTLPRDIQQLPVDRDGMQYTVPMLFDTAGTFCYQPLAIAVAQGM